MDDAEKASREWVSGRIGTMVISARLQEAFLAGAAWQRDRMLDLIHNDANEPEVAEYMRNRMLELESFDASNESKKTEVPK